MPTTIPAIAPVTDLTVTERSYLALWGRANRLEVSVEAAGSGRADDVAYIGLGYGMASWVIRRYVGQLWLSLVSDQAGRRCEGWTVAVSSVEEATTKIAGMLATGWR